MIRLSCATLSFDGFGDNDFRNTFRHAAGVGYRHIEFNCWYPSTLTPATMAEVRRRCTAHGLAPSSIHVLGFGGEGNAGMTKDLCHKMRAVDAAAELGCALVSTTGAARGSEGGLESIIAVLKHLMPYAEGKGVAVSLENHQNNNIETTDDYARIFDEIDSSHLGITVDTGHFEASGVSVLDVVDRFFEKINHVHLKENGVFGKKTFTPFGQGSTDNVGIVRALIERGYSGYLVVEVSPEIEGMEWDISLVSTPFRMFEEFGR